MENRVLYMGPAQTWEEALERLRGHTGFIAADTETVSTSDQRCIGIGIALSATEAFYFPMFEDEDSQHARSPWWKEPLAALRKYRNYWFNISFDLEVLDPFMPDVDLIDWQDFSMAARIQGMHGALDMNAGEYLAIHHQVISDILPKNAQGKTKGNMLSVSMQDAGWKCMHDCTATWQLVDMIQMERWMEGEEPYIWRDIWKREYDVTPKMIRAYHTDRQLVPILRKMGKAGLKLDVELLRRHYTRLAAEKFQYSDYCLQRFGFNPGSDVQAASVLAKRGNFLPWTKTGKFKRLSVAGDVLKGLDDPLAYWILEYRKRADLMSDVIEPLLGKPSGESSKKKKTPYAEWQAHERFITHFKLDLATSRLSSYRRNIQNITPSIREIFVPDNGVFTYWDANQIEYRIFGNLSQEPNILNAYRDKINVHEVTMEKIWPGQKRWPNGKDGLENPLYTDAKTGNYSVMYRVQAETLSKRLERDKKFAGEFIAGWRKNHPTAVKWQDEQIAWGYDHDWVETLEGRRPRLPDIAQQGQEHRDTCTINYQVQGAAAWPIKMEIIKQDKDGIDQRVQLHDEVLMDGDYTGYFPWWSKETPVSPDGHGLQFAGMEVPIEVKRGVHWF